MPAAPELFEGSGFLLPTFSMAQIRNPKTETVGINGKNSFYTLSIVCFGRFSYPSEERLF